MHERLYRSRTDRVLFGVAGGMADWLDVDPSVVRLVWAILVVFGGAGLILYIIAALVIPEEPWESAAMPGMPPGPVGGTTPASGGAAPSSGEAGSAAPLGGAPAGAYPSWAEARAARRAARAARRAERGNSAGVIFGVILILVGGWFLLRAYVPGLDDRWLWPGLIVVVGVLLVAAAFRRPPAP